MGLLNGILGGASEVEVAEIEADLAKILAEGEAVGKAFVTIRDLLVFTDRRLLMVDKQGMTGKKRQYHSVPYRSITHFVVQSQGHFDLDSELKIWVIGQEEPLRLEFRRDASVLEIQRALAQHL